jgi:CubicO group peptidase (beta-lactamase class C family)
MQRRAFILSGAAALATVRAPRLRSAPQPKVSVDPRRLQQLLDETARALGVVGAQLAVFDGSQVHEVVTGLANLERRLAVTTDTLFQIGSTTKLFNAATIMALVDEGKLDLDQPVKTWIDDFRLPGSAAERITLRQLLSMSAGIDNGPYQSYGRGDDALGRYVASLAEIPLIFEPGTAFGYSNAGSNIAGFAAQRSQGKTWEALLAEKVLGPLGLEHAANFPEDLLYHPVALGYQRADGAEPRLVTSWGLTRSMAPAGGTFCASAGDLVRFARMFLDGGRSVEGKQVLSPAAVKTMHTPQVRLPARVTAQQWCPGPYWKQWGGETIYGHSGTNTSGSSMLLWIPARNLAIATIANVANQGYPLADRVFDTVFPEMFGIIKPKAPTAATVVRVRVDLARYVGRFEAYRSGFEFVERDGRLMARVLDSGMPSTGASATETELIPMGDDRFLPADPAMGGNRGWDVAFWGKDGQGRATHYLNGVFGMRRT